MTTTYATIPLDAYDPARHRLPVATMAMEQGALVRLTWDGDTFTATLCNPREASPHGILIADVQAGEAAVVLVHGVLPGQVVVMREGKHQFEALTLASLAQSPQRIAVLPREQDAP